MSGTVESEHGPSAGNADTDLLDARRVLAGDVAAFEGIVRRWQGRLINLAWRFCHDRTMAEDMAQDAFVKVFQALKTFRGESEFSTWVMAVTSVAELLAVLTSPPPATVAVLVTLAGALAATATVSVSAG